MSLSPSVEAGWMERLRSKSSNYRPASELSRVTRTTLLDRRTAPDAVDRQSLRSCLDLLASSVPAKDAASVADRLEAVAKKAGAGLNFMAAPAHGCFYLSTDMFYVEINIESGSGSAARISEAKVHHIDATVAGGQSSHNNAKKVPEIIQCLSKGDFQTFVKHLEGLIAIYDLKNASPQEKSKAWNALNIVEQDLERMYSVCSRSAGSDVMKLIHQTPLGYLEPRAGGIPMKLRYFLPPYDMLDENTGCIVDPDGDSLKKQDLGFSVTVGLETSEVQRRLPISGMVTSKNVEIPLTASNSVKLPARLVLRLNKPLVLSTASCKEIARLTEIDFFDENTSMPLMQLIVKTSSNNVLDSANNRGLFVTLPDQQHCYFMTDHHSLKGTVVSSIPFTHPMNVPEILAILRKQAIFNTLVSSCVRVNSVQDLEKSVMFEVSSMDLHHLNVTFEMPNEEGMATVELDLTNIAETKCRVYSMSSSGNGGLVCPEDVACKVAQRCLSIPITMRNLIRHGKKDRPDPDPDPDAVASSLNSNNYTSSGHFVSSSSAAAPIGFSSQNANEMMDLEGNTIGSEPMDVGEEQQQLKTTTTPRGDSLNANRPQDAALNSGAATASATSTTVTTTTTSTVAKPSDESATKAFKATLKAATELNRPDSKKINNNQQQQQQQNKSGSTAKSDLLKAMKATANNKGGGSSKVDIKPSVSITPVSSAQSTTNMSLKKAGIEIIPLGDKPPEMDAKDAKWHKEVRRSLSEDDKRKMDKKESSKKRKHEHFSKSGQGDKKSGSSSLKRHLTPPRPSMNHKDGSIKSSPKSKLGSVIDRLTSTSSSSGGGPDSIEILPAHNMSSSSSKKDRSSSSSSSSANKHSSSSSLKFTIKNSSGSSSSSASKHRSSEYHKSSSSSSSKGSSKYSSSTSSVKRSSPSMSMMSSPNSSQQKHKSYSPGSSSGSSSKGGSGSGDKDKLREKQREMKEDLKRLLSGNKLNTTFQIPKRAKLEEGSSPALATAATTAVAASTTTTAASSSSSVTSVGGAKPSGQSKSANASPKYNVSPKYGTSPKMPSSTSISPKQAGSFGLNNSPRYIGGGATTPPNISPKHTTAPGMSSKKTPSSSPTHAQPTTTTAASPTLKLPPPPPSLNFMAMPRNASPPGPVQQFATIDQDKKTNSETKATNSTEPTPSSASNEQRSWSIRYSVMIPCAS